MSYDNNKWNYMKDLLKTLVDEHNAKFEEVCKVSDKHNAEILGAKASVYQHVLQVMFDLDNNEHTDEEGSSGQS